jgi:hypothetical protein
MPDTLNALPVVLYLILMNLYVPGEPHVRFSHLPRLYNKKEMEHIQYGAREHKFLSTEPYQVLFAQAEFTQVVCTWCLFFNPIYSFFNS